MTYNSDYAQCQFVIDKLCRILWAGDGRSYKISEIGSSEALEDVNEHHNDSCTGTQDSKCVGCPGIATAVFSDVNPIKCLPYPNRGWYGPKQISDYNSPDQVNGN